MNPETMPPVDRRSFLRTAALLSGGGIMLAAAPTLLSACGGSSSSSSGVISLDPNASSRSLVGLFNYSGDFLVSTIPQRLPFAIATAEGPPATDGPATLTVQLHFGDSPVGEPITLERHAEGTPITDYPLVTTFAETGIWSITTELDGSTSSQSFQVQAPDTVPLLQIGHAMAPVQSPTVDDARGVDPICTHVPPCPLHTRTITQAIAAAAPIALLISTPQFCQTGVCGPVLDMLLELQAEFPQVQFLHTEVYNDPNNGGDPAAKGVTETVSAYGLSFEPSLFIADAGAVIRTRLDNIFDRNELRESLTRVS